MSAALRKGWCPDAFHPMESGDGLILRLKILGGRLGADTAQALAQYAADYGNGLIDLSSRGNLQLRGVTHESVAELQKRLAALGLIDAEPAAEAVRNIMAAPLAGVDQAALFDIRPLVAALDTQLRRDQSLHRLPDKFLFVIDDGGLLPLPLAKADIAFLAVRVADDMRFGIYLAGQAVGSCTSDEVCETATRLAQIFLDLRDGNRQRMTDVIARSGKERIVAAAKLAPAPISQANARTPATQILGFHNLGSYAALGLGITFGRLDARALRLLAAVAAEIGGELRLTAQRAIFLIAKHIAPALIDRLRAAGFWLDDQAPIRAVAACPGRPACRQAETSSQSDGAKLAPIARALAAHGIALHISACAKGCAHSDSAPVTLIGRNGAYDIVLDGRADDDPLLRGLNLHDAATLLQRLAACAPKDRAVAAGKLFGEASQ